MPVCYDHMQSMSHWGQFPVGYQTAQQIAPGVYTAVYVPVDIDGEPLYEPWKFDPMLKMSTSRQR